MAPHRQDIPQDLQDLLLNTEPWSVQGGDQPHLQKVSQR